jgi:hypothetical protein
VKQLPKSVGAGNPHATFCGNRGRATASGDPVLGVKLPGPTRHSATAVYQRPPFKMLFETAAIPLWVWPWLFSVDWCSSSSSREKSSSFASRVRRLLFQI